MKARCDPDGGRWIDPLVNLPKSGQACLVADLKRGRFNYTVAIWVQEENKPGCFRYPGLLDRGPKIYPLCYQVIDEPHDIVWSGKRK